MVLGNSYILSYHRNDRHFIQKDNHESLNIKIIHLSQDCRYQSVYWSYGRGPCSHMDSVIPVYNNISVQNTLLILYMCSSGQEPVKQNVFYKARLGHAVSKDSSFEEVTTAHFNLSCLFSTSQSCLLVHRTASF